MTTFNVIPMKTICKMIKKGLRLQSLSSILYINKHKITETIMYNKTIKSITDKKCYDYNIWRN